MNLVKRIAIVGAGPVGLPEDSRLRGIFPVLT